MNNIQEKARLLLFGENGEIIREFELDQQNMVIGRTRSANIPLKNDLVSRIHAQVFYSDAGYYISDMNSTNGTYLNGKQLRINQLLRLSSNDTIELGSLRMMFQLVPETLPVAGKETPAPTEDSNAIHCHKRAIDLTPEQRASLTTSVKSIQTQNLEAKRELIDNLKHKLNGFKEELPGRQMQIKEISNPQEHIKPNTHIQKSDLIENPDPESQLYKSFNQDFETHYDHYNQNFNQGLSSEYQPIAQNTPTATIQKKPQPQAKPTPERDFNFLNVTEEEIQAQQKTQKKDILTLIQQVYQDLKETALEKLPKGKLLLFSTLALIATAGSWSYYHYTPLFG